jgi:hypothetical protein
MPRMGHRTASLRQAARLNHHYLHKSPKQTLGSPLQAAGNGQEQTLARFGQNQTLIVLGKVRLDGLGNK